MFSYFGSKSKLVKYYPEPKYDVIIEPFAGSAQYAFRYWNRKVILVEKYNRIAAVWKWLIEEATPETVLSLPLFNRQEKIEHPNQAIRDLIGLESSCAAGGSPRPRPNKYNRWIKGGRERIANNLHKIKHWQIICGDYIKAPDIKATWFIDPPYNNQSQKDYRIKFTGYDKLAEWCKFRKGQVIVCEGSNADWLPFEPLITFWGQKHIRQELIWTNTKYNLF